MKKRMLINVADEEESRVAIVEDGILEEFTIETASKEQNKGNIYNGVIAKVEPSLQAAFVDYGGNRHGFLPIGEVQSRWFNDGGKSAEDRDKRPRIQDVLQRNQRVIVAGREGGARHQGRQPQHLYLPARPLPGAHAGVRDLRRHLAQDRGRGRAQEVEGDRHPARAAPGTWASSCAPPG